MTVDGEPVPTIPVTTLMDCPDGMVRRGDEYLDPQNWVCCPECGVDCPSNAETCFNCGAVLVE